MKNQPNKATVKDGLPTAEEVLKAKVPSALYNSGNCYVGHALDAMQEYSDQQNAELRERVKELKQAVVAELESVLEQLKNVHAEYAEDIIKERISILKHGI